jgi:hypothetical protein
VSPEEQALAGVITLLERLEIPFMLTGSMAASYHGKPRSTHDAGVVIDPDQAQMDSLVDALEAGGYYVDRDRATRALHTRTHFNVIEQQHASKIDLIVRRERPFSEEEFRRRIVVDMPFARGISIVTPEDAILSKLEWARAAGDSERQLADAAGVLALNRNLDRAYVERWARDLGIFDLWARIAGQDTTR